MYSNINADCPTDFPKLVLSWSFSTFEKPLPSAVQQPPLPKREKSIPQYYRNFIPFILEESRAIIAEGLEKAHQYSLLSTSNMGKKNKSTAQLNDAKPFRLILKKKPRFPQNEENPLSLTFAGAIPEKIEHGKTMNVLLLKTTGIAPEKRFIALASENFENTQLFVKIILSREDYDNNQKCFEQNAQWQAQYLGSVISEQRMYDACLAANNIACVQQIARSRIPEPDLSFALTSRDNIQDLNLAQREAIQAFLNAEEGSVMLLQGPPGTGKTTTVVKLLKQVAANHNRILVSAHSNKGVQVLASRALKDMPDMPMMLAGVESKISDELKPIFLHRWHDRITSYLISHTDELELCAAGEFSEIDISVDELILTITNNVYIVQQELVKFGLLFFNGLNIDKKTELFRLMPNPISMNDFDQLQNSLNRLKGSPYAEEKWQFLSGIITEILSKWKKVNRSKLELYLLNHAKIIFATLITSGRDSMLEMDPIDFLLVDEAAQSVEAATLIPMQYKPSKVLLVGDTKQLPATVISKMLDDEVSRHAHSTHYKWSMMWRLIEENNAPSLMLNIQYRMHPHICQWPSSQYYGDRLITSPQILPMKLSSSVGITSRPYAIYEVSGQDITEDYSYSICNHEEAKYIIDIIGLIRKKCPTQSIGVITPYVAQKRLVNEKLKKRRPSFEMVDVNTVDGFQGDERDIIIISFTRTHVSQFLKEFRRLNVAITRPKYCLIILGSPGLSSSDIGALFEDARLRGVLYPEHALKTILRTGTVLNTIQERQPASDLKSLAWQADPHSQFMYAQAIEPRNKSSAFVWYRRAAENNHAEGQYHVSQFYLTDNTIVKKDTQLGMQWLIKSAEKAVPAAEYALGIEFLTGNHIRQNISAGMDLCERAANRNFIYAILLLAKCYEEGINVASNIGRSQAYYRRAAKLDHTEAMMKLAASLTQGNIENKREAVKWYRNAANRQVVTAYYPLAELLNDVLDSQVEALKWYCKAADVGNVDAQYKVAVRFMYGTHGCVINLAKAIFYLRQASWAEHTGSQFMLATCFNEGVGVSIDKQEAMGYFQKAADQGHNESRYQFALLKEKEAVHVAYRYYLKAANNNHYLAQYACIRYQLQFSRDLETCLQFCQQLATDKDPPLQFLLARLLHTGVANIKEEAKAYYYYSRLLRDEDYTVAYFYCANMLETGRGVKQDLKLAQQYYTQCSAKLAIAKLYLARSFLQADDYEKNEKTAIEILNSYRAEKSQPIKIDFMLDYYLAQKILQIPLPDFTAFTYSIDTDSAYANYWLGMLFQEGKKVKQDEAKAIRFLQKAADSGHMEAQYQVGLLLTKVSRYASYPYYKQAAQQGHRLAQEVCIPYQLETKKDLSDCLHFCEQLAVLGNQQMQFLLARMLDSGIAETIDKAKAYQYYALLANDNVAIAEYYCGNLLETGSGIDRNISLACEYYERCAEKIPLAKLRLARLLLDSKNDKHNEQKAVDILKSYHAKFNEETIVDPWLPNKRLQPLLIEDVWAPDFSLFISSIETNSIYANYSLGMIFKNGERVRQSDNKAAIFFKKSAAFGHAASFYQLGLLIEKQSRQLAYPHYKKAAEQGHIDALYECIRYQLEFRQDLPCCLDFCKKVVLQNAFPVQFILARLLDSGIAGYTDKPSAYSHYLQAVEKAHPIAAYYCGYMTEHGIGIEQSLSLAIQYYEKCIQQSFPAKLRLACLLLQYRTFTQDARLLAEKEKQAVELLRSYYREYHDTPLDRLNELERMLEKIIKDFGKQLQSDIPQIKTQSIEANYYLGRISEEGKGVSVNIPYALNYYQVISCDFPEAAYRIGYIHEFGVGNIPRNKDVAKGYYESAANRGHSLAAKRLTISYSFFSLVSDKDDKTLIEEDNKNCLVM